MLAVDALVGLGSPTSYSSAYYPVLDVPLLKVEADADLDHGVGGCGEGVGVVVRVDLVEGALGGVAGSAIVACLYAWILVKTGRADQTYFWVFILIGAVGAIVSQVGDLTASAFKRNFEIKDYGTLIPGHGGILDRFDSVLFSAPMICLLAELLGRYLS